MTVYDCLSEAGSRSSLRSGAVLGADSLNLALSRWWESSGTDAETSDCTLPGRDETLSSGCSAGAATAKVFGLASSIVRTTAR